MTKREILLSFLIGILLGGITSACFLSCVERGLAARDAATGIDSKAIIQEVLQ